MREIITVQVGQCGNQIGRRFWLEMLHEAAIQPQHGYDASMSALFRNVDVRYEPPIELHVGSLLSSVRARAILVDTEEAVVAETMRDPVLRDLFDESQLITDVSGAGNNWAQGYCEYGPRSRPRIEAAARRALEACDSPQAFFFLHSVGGGTGSGLGSSALELMRDVFPDVCRFSVAVYFRRADMPRTGRGDAAADGSRRRRGRDADIPWRRGAATPRPRRGNSVETGARLRYPSGDDDDVITGPYNAVLSTRWLTEASDAVVPVENKALLDACSRQKCKAERESGFDAMNDVVAQLLSHLTAGARYPGSLNLDINEIATNLVPFPRLHYLTASFSPLLTRAWGTPNTNTGAGTSKTLQRLCSEACMPTSRLVASNPANKGACQRSLACALLGRGGTISADLTDAAERLRPTLRLSGWNPDGLKIGACAVPPLRSSSAVLCLNNSSGIVFNFNRLRERFNKLYNAKAMLHHYTQIMELDGFEEAIHDLESVIAGYETAAR